MIFKTKLPDLDKFEDVVIGQELRMEELEPEIAQLRGYVGKKTQRRIDGGCNKGLQTRHIQPAVPTSCNLPKVV